MKNIMPEELYKGMKLIDDQLGGTTPLDIIIQFKDDSNDGNANCMKNHEFDGAFCDNVLQILDRTLPKPRFRDSADQFGLVGTIESAPLKARKRLNCS